MKTVNRKIGNGAMQQNAECSCFGNNSNFNQYFLAKNRNK